MQNNYVLGIDLGSSKICCVICELDKEHNFTLKGVGTGVSMGIEDGFIVDEEALVKALKRVIQRASVDAGGISSTDVVVSFPYGDIQCIQKTGHVVSHEASNQIASFHKLDCLKQIKQQMLHDQVVLHMVPYAYKVDGVDVLNPIGVFGKSLEVTTSVIVGSQSNLSKMQRVFAALGCTIKGMVYMPLGLIELLFSKKQDHQTAALIDIGGSFTTISLIRSKFLIETQVIPFGSAVFNSDLAECLDISIPEAERLKVVHGNLFLKDVNPQEMVMVMGSDNVRRDVKKYLLCQILEARFSELITMVKARLSFEDLSTLFLTGGGSSLGGVGDYLSSLSIPHVVVGVPTEYKPVIEDVSYIGAIGNLFYALKNQAVSYQPLSFSTLGMVKQWFSKVF